MRKIKTSVYLIEIMIFLIILILVCLSSQLNQPSFPEGVFYNGRIHMQDTPKLLLTERRTKI